MAKILQIGMIPHNMTLFKFICVQYQFHGQTLPIMKIDRGQIQFREYVSTGTEPWVMDNNCVKYYLAPNFAVKSYSPDMDFGYECTVTLTWEI